MNDLSVFVDEEVIRIVRNLSIYNHIVKSTDHESFRDVRIQQWDSTTASILCYLKKEHKALFTQSKLLAIARLAAIQILKQEGKYKNPADKCLTDSL